jgi:iron-sulfur cluster assembly protein
MSDVVAIETKPQNAIFISEKAAEKVRQLMDEAGVANDPTYFLRVGVVGGGCSGLSYKMDFDNEIGPTDQQFEDQGLKLVTDLKSFLYLVNTMLEFSDGLNGKGFFFSNPNASRTCGCGESFSV